MKLYADYLALYQNLPCKEWLRISIYLSIHELAVFFFFFNPVSGSRSASKPLKRTITKKKKKKREAYLTLVQSRHYASYPLRVLHRLY